MKSYLTCLNFFLKFHLNFLLSLFVACLIAPVAQTHVYVIEMLNEVNNQDDFISFFLSLQSIINMDSLSHF